MTDGEDGPEDGPTRAGSGDSDTGRLRLIGALIAAGLLLYGIAAPRGRRQAALPRGLSVAAPGGIPARGWWTILKRVWLRSGADNLSMMAAGIGFYSLLSLFPALSALISLWGLIANPHEVQRLVGGLQGLMPQQATALVSTQLDALLGAGTRRLGLGLVVSLVFALWTTNYATATLMTALNGVYDERERRSYLAVTATGLALTSGLVLFGLLSLLLVAILPAIIGVLPIPDDWRHVIGLIRWPILLVLLMSALAALYRYGPCRQPARWRWVSWGAVMATILWFAVSYGFSVYVARFSTYDRTYGSLGAVAVVMMWFYLTAYVVLLGAELNAEMEDHAARNSAAGPARPLGRRGARKADTAPAAS